jgi:undecaprenyl diphosphate synthase
MFFLKEEDNKITYSNCLDYAKSINLNLEKLPKHIAFIMDGNGRWATSQGQQRTFGHKKGVGTVKDLVKTFRHLGLPVMTIYAFSTENWNRSKKEVSFLMSLFEQSILNECQELKENGVRVKFIGNKEEFKESLREKINWIENETKEQNQLILNVAANYGGRREIINACKNIAEDFKKGKFSLDEINESLFENYLYTKGLPDPDLIIRTSGEYRLSNYLLWQSAYSEIYITKTNWPDFTIKEFVDIIFEFQNRNRRFGKEK